MALRKNGVLYQHHGGLFPMTARRLVTLRLLAAMLPLVMGAPALPVYAAETGAASQPQPAPPPEAVAGALNGGPGVAALTAYFESWSAPQDVVARAAMMIEAIKARSRTESPEKLLAALDRINGAATNALDISRVLRLSVEPDFVPQRAVTALDFGFREMPVAPGFESVVQGDPRLQGSLASLRQPGEQGLLADGIAGIRRIAIPVSGPGPYRIVLMSRDMGNAELTRAAFGGMVRVNGAPYFVRGADPSQWLNMATLSNRGPALVGASFDGRSSLVMGRPDANQLAQGAGQQGAALIINGVPVEGQLLIELIGQGNTFLTALLIEIADQPSNFVLSPEALAQLVPFDLRQALEAELQAFLAAALEQFNPAAGGPQPPGPPVRLNELNTPVFPSDTSASPG